MKIKIVFISLFLCLSLTTLGLSGCSFGGHIGTESHTVSME
jgi:hypothetical protein